MKTAKKKCFLSLILGGKVAILPESPPQPLSWAEVLYVKGTVAVGSGGAE